MFDWIPAQLYSLVYYYIITLIVLIILIDSHLKQKPNNDKFQYFGFFFIVGLILYIGLRPVSGLYFGDTKTYSQIFSQYSRGAPITTNKDYTFHYLMKISSYIMNIKAFFVFCAILYLFPLYVISKRWFNDLWFYGFIFLVTTFSFWAYGTNGVRNGIAGSIFLLGVSRNKKINQFIFIFLAVAFHKAMLLPTAGFIIAQLYNKPKMLIRFWIFCIPISLIAGGLFENFFGSFDFDDRLEYLTAGNVNNDDFSSTGFRWDFILYSASAIFAGWYYIAKKKYEDKLYGIIFNTYIISNAFWILIIRSNFSNRFAYLSWFLIGIIIVYPLLRKNIISKQYKTVGFILLIQFSFTFLMNIILS